LTNIKWDDSKFKTSIKGKVLNKLKAIGFLMIGDMREDMFSAAGQYSEISSKKVVKGVRRTQGKKPKRHYPSPPGSPPAVDYGRLWASLSVNWNGSGMSNGRVAGKAKPEDGIKEPSAQPDKVSVVVGTNIQNPPYPFFLELGTSKMEPRPFVRPVFQKYKGKIVNAMKKR